MQDYQQRVVTEKEELDDKLSRLIPFVGSPRFSSLPAAEQERMSRQLRIMREYSEVLGERIANFA